MMELCVEFALQRETFYIAVNLVDRYIMRTLNIAKGQFQLIGVTALFIAAKLEVILSLY